MVWNSFEKRKFPRVQKECAIAIDTEGKKETFNTVTENIGIGGVCVQLPKPLQPFSKVQIHLVFQQGMDPIDCLCRVAWSIKNSNFDPKLISYDIGFEFLDLSPENHERLEKFLLSFA